MTEESRLPDELYKTITLDHGRIYRVCRGCDKMSSSRQGIWHHQRYCTTDYFACSRKCWDATLRGYPELLAALKAEALQHLNNAEQDMLLMAESAQRAKDALAVYEKIEPLKAVSMEKPDEPATT